MLQPESSGFSSGFSGAPGGAAAWLVAGLIGVLVGHVGPAHADGKQVEELIMKATRAFADADWAGARTAADEAESAARAAELAGDKLMAKVHVVQGAVAVQGAHNPGKGIEYFRRALRVDPEAKLTRTLAQPDVIKAFKNALIMNRTEAAAAGPAPPAEKAAEKPAPAVKETAVAKPAEKRDEAEEEDEDEDVSLEELRRRARAAKEDQGGKKQQPIAKEAAKEAPPKPEAKPVVVEKKKPAPPPKPEEPEEPDLPVAIPQPLHCPNPDEAPPRQAAVLRCVAKPGVPATRVVLYYRLPGKEDFVSVPASKTKRGWYIATAPAEAFNGKFMQYYLEARNASDKPVATNGEWDSPNLMMIRAGAAPLLTTGLGVRMASNITMSEENPLAEEQGPMASLKKMWIALSLGTGFGFHGDTTLEWYVERNSTDPSQAAGGMRSAGMFVVAPQLGYQLNDRWAVAIETRHQFILREGSDDMMAGAPAVGAHSLLAKGIMTRPMPWFGANKLHLSAALGGGEGARLVVPPDAAAARPRTSSDSVHVGPVLAGLGAAADIPIGGKLSLRVTLPQILMGLPDFGFVFDVGIGMAYDL